MKKYIFFCFILLVGCDETTDFLESLNEAPQINFSSNADSPVLQDSIKLGVTSQVKYRISLRVTDKNKNISQIVYTQLSGQGRLKQRDIDIISNNITFSQEESLLVFDYYPESLGLHKLGLTVYDNFGLSNAVSIEITAFDNLLPVAMVSWTKRGDRGKYHYEIRTGESFDRDSRFGGAIVEYEYKTQGVIHQILATTEDATRYQVIFPEKNIYPYEVRVRDNDGKWSAPFRGEILVD